MSLAAVRPIQFELDPEPGVATLELVEPAYCQARVLTATFNCRLRIRRIERRKYTGWELRVDDAGARPVAVLLTPDRGGQASATATRLVECGDGVLTQGPPW